MSTFLGTKDLFEGIDLGNAVSKSTRAISDSVSGLKSQLVNPIKSVTGSIKEGVATIKEGTTEITGTISAYKSKAILGIDESLKNLSGGILNASNIGSIIQYKNGLKVNTDQLLRLATKGLGYNVYSMEDLKNQLGESFISELDEMSGGIAKNLFFADGGKIAFNKDWEYDMGQSLIDFLGKDDSAFGTAVNYAALNSVLNATLRNTVKMGMWQGYGAYQAKYLFKEDYIKTLINSVEFAIQAGDVASLEEIVRIVETEGVNTIKAKYPDINDRLLSSYNLPEGTTPDKYPALRTALKNILVVLGGESWYKTFSQFGMVTNMALVNSISDDAKFLLSEYEEYIPFLCAAGIFQERTAIEVFSSHFPKAVIL